MLNTGVNAGSKVLSRKTDSHFLSILTSLFVEGLFIQGSRPPEASDWSDEHHATVDDQNAVRLPTNSKSTFNACQIKEYCNRKPDPQNTNRNTFRAQSDHCVRTFVLELSDVLNDLLMGIWGNLSLLNMTLDKSNPVRGSIGQMEALIQNGASYINAIFGYLGERRGVAKRIRLSQLIQELIEYIPLGELTVHHELIQANLMDLSRQTYTTSLAGNLVRVIEQLVNRIQLQYDQVVRQNVSVMDVRRRLKIINRLIAKARGIIEQLNYYSGQPELKYQKINLHKLAESEVRKLKGKCDYLSVSLDMKSGSSHIRADRKMLRFVFNQLLENAVAAMPDGGHISISVEALGTEAAPNRRTASRWRSAIVVTVADNGQGMDLDTLLHVFDPFFSIQRRAGHLGLGMAATWGIVKAHGGYIHVRSKKGQGSTFRIFLPISFSQHCRTRASE